MGRRKEEMRKTEKDGRQDENEKGKADEGKRKAVKSEDIREKRGKTRREMEELHTKERRGEEIRQGGKGDEMIKWRRVSVDERGIEVGVKRRKDHELREKHKRKMKIRRKKRWRNW